MTPGHDRDLALSVVIPVRNGTAVLGSQLESLAAQGGSCRFEIVVSDNGSSDDLVGFLECASSTWPQLEIRLVDSSGKVGVSHARNAGVAHARARNVAFCDADDVVYPNWVSAMAEALDKWDAVGGPLDESSLNAPGVHAQGHVGSALPIGMGYQAYAVGANCGVRTDVWASLDGFDETFVLGAEEVDFFWRLQAAGYTLGFAESATVAYRHRRDPSARRRQAYRYGIGSCQLAAKHRAAIPRESVQQIVHSWLQVGGHLLLAPSTSARQESLRRLAHKVGQVVGSARYRILHLA